MAYVTTYLYCLYAAAAIERETGKVVISCGPVMFKMSPAESAELARQIAVALEAAGDIPDHLPEILPPLTPAQLAEGDACEERR